MMGMGMLILKEWSSGKWWLKKKARLARKNKQGCWFGSQKPTTVVFKEEDLQSITECKCCFKQLYTFYVGRVLDEEQEFPNVFWTFERADLNRKANFKSEETPAQWMLNDNLSESEKA